MNTFAEYSKEILTIIMNGLKNGVSGSTIADTLVNDYGFNRKSALTLIAGTILMINNT